jgi:hypothetical protein
MRVKVKYIFQGQVQWLMPMIKATEQVEIGESPSEASQAKKVRLYLEKGWRYGSSVRRFV